MFEFLAIFVIALWCACLQFGLIRLRSQVDTIAIFSADEVNRHEIRVEERLREYRDRLEEVEDQMPLR